MVKINTQLTIFQNCLGGACLLFQEKSYKKFFLLKISPRAKQCCVVGSMLPASYGLSGPKLQSVNGKWTKTDNHR